MVPVHRGFGRHVGFEGKIVARSGEDRIEVEHRREQDNAVERHVPILQVVDQRRRARGAVTFAEQKLGRVPAIVERDVALDELCERGGVLIDAEDRLVVDAGHHPAVAGSRCVDKDEIRLVEQAVLIVDQRIRRPGVRLRVGGKHDAPRAEGTHVEIDRRRAGTTVVEKGHRAARTIGAVLRVGNVKHAGLGSALLGLEDQISGGRGVTDRASIDRNLMVGHDRMFLRHRLGGRTGCGLSRFRGRRGRRGERHAHKRAKQR